MYRYSLIQWLFFFYFYCFFGWCFESAYVSLSKKRFVNRGFIRGPFLPLYGSGAIIMLLVSGPFCDNIVMVYIAGCFGATLLELVTGIAMETLFKVRYWDYSHKRFNFRGYICLESTLAWGLLTVLMTQFIHRQVERLMFLIPGSLLTVIVLVLTAGIFSDFALSFKAALDLRDLLLQMEKVKTEMQRIQKRLDVLIALAGEEFENRREKLAQQKVVRMDDIKEHVEKLREAVRERSSNYSENKREEIRELFAGYRRSLEERELLGSRRDHIQRSLLSSNPGMKSKRFAESLEELKKKWKVPGQEKPAAEPDQKAEHKQ